MSHAARRKDHLHRREDASPASRRRHRLPPPKAAEDQRFICLSRLKKLAALFHRALLGTVDTFVDSFADAHALRRPHRAHRPIDRALALALFFDLNRGFVLHVCNFAVPFNNFDRACLTAEETPSTVTR